MSKEVRVRDQTKCHKEQELLQLLGLLGSWQQPYESYMKLRYHEFKH